jgi:hypothetical protein
MGDRQEFAGINDPRQHLIDLGVDAGFVDMVKTILEHASQFDEIGIVIRSGIVNTGLGGSQITSPIVRVLYTNDP